MFVVLECGGRQYKVSPGQKIKVEKLTVPEGSSFVFDKILLLADGEKIEIGRPYLKDNQLEGKVLKQGRGKKLIVFRYQPKTRRRIKKGHRQPYTEIEIISVKK